MFLKNFLNKFIEHSKDINEDISNKHNISKKWYQNVTRVLDYRSLEIWDHCHGFHWNSEYTKNPAVIEKIFNHLRTAYSIKLYITNTHIEYSAYTIKHGFVCGSCRRGYYGYSFFEFGLTRSGHRWDIYGEDKDNPTIKTFYEWWENLVKPYEEEFDNDYNL